MHPGEDPALAARFLGWLQARHAPHDGLAGDVLRLTELGAWGLSAQQAEALPLPDEDRAALLQLHAHWLAFAAEIPAEWAEISGDEDDVTWVDAARDEQREAPTGEAPRLVSSRIDSPLRARPARRFTRTDLLPLLALLAAVGVITATELGLREAVRAELAPRSYWDLAALREAARMARRDRLATQAFVSAKAADLCARQRRAVSMTCEGGPWCAERLRSLDHRIETLLGLQAAAGDASPGHVPVWPVPAVGAERAALEDELAALEGSAPDDAASQQRRPVVEAELAVLASELAAP